jgi:energy-coupling factor transporter ATP-binding protein EcfA2
MIPSQVLSAEQLNLPESMLKLCRLKKGMVLVTGPTGSGKSTTLAALIDYINQNDKGHILTVEDPIEFVHQNKSCLVSQRQIGENVESFTDALRAALRGGSGHLSWSVRCATWKRFRGDHRGGNGPTWCSARCTRPARRKRSTASSTLSR